MDKFKFKKSQGDTD